MRVQDDDDAGAHPQSFADDPPNYTVQTADWDDAGGATRIGLSAKSDAAGFSPIRINKGRQHTLEVDPRTKLKIINVPAERRVAFADLQDAVIHVFLDCFKITSGDQCTDRVVIITDSTLFLSHKNGAVSRCFTVDLIKMLFVTNDNKALGIQVPSEYDLLLKFQNPSDRDRVIKVLRTVYRRLTHTRLNVETTRKRKLDAAAYKINKPKNFRPTVIPQKTKEQLRQALEVFERQEEALLEEIDLLQDEMEERHRAQMEEYQAQLNSNLQKLNDTIKLAWENEAKLTKLREDVSKGRQLIEQVDGPFGLDGELPLSKDAQIAEMELVVARLNAAVYASTTAQIHRSTADSVGNYIEKDMVEQLYHPTWPGESSNTDPQSLCQSVADRIAEIDEEIAKLGSILEQGQAAEAKLQYTEERIAFLRHIQRTKSFESYSQMAIGGKQAAAAAGGGGGGGDAGPVHALRIEDYDPQHSWLADLPQEITAETLTADPRTGLSFIDVPTVMRPYFSVCQNAVLHFFAIVKKASKMGELVKRILLISDQALYLATPNAKVKRCLDVLDIDEILLDSGFSIGFRSTADYDLTFTCVSGEHRQEIVDILQKIYRHASGGRAIPVSEIPRHQRLEAFLKLNQPPNYVMQMIPFRKRAELAEAIREKRDVILFNAPASLAVTAKVPSDLKMPEEQYLQLRASVARQMEYEWRQDAVLVQMRGQIDHFDQQVHGVEEEVRSLKRQIDSHRCEDGKMLHAGSLPVAPGGGIVPSGGAGAFHPQADGLFFINVDPVTLDCHLDITKLTFNDELLFTGHMNGFINVWDLAASNHSLVRTLREHTGKVTDLCISGTSLFSSSKDANIRQWDLRTGRSIIYSAHRGAVNAIHADAGKLISGGVDKDLRVWDIERQECINNCIGHRTEIVDLKFKDNMVVSAEWGWTIFWDIRTGKQVRSLKDELGGVRCLDYCDGIAVCGGTGGDITIWDVAQGAGETIGAHKDDILDLQLCGKAVVSSSSDFTIKMWDIALVKSLGTFHESHPFETKTFFMKGKKFVAGQSQFAKIWSK